MTTATESGLPRSVFGWAIQPGWLMYHEERFLKVVEWFNKDGIITVRLDTGRPLPSDLILRLSPNDLVLMVKP